MALASHTVGSPYFAWYLGLILGFAAVVVVVVLAAVLLPLASRLGDQARQAGEVATLASRGAPPAPALRRANDSAEAILDLARRARTAVATAGRR